VRVDILVQGGAVQREESERSGRAGDNTLTGLSTKQNFYRIPHDKEKV
jgi:hypothetical protein